MRNKHDNDVTVIDDVEIIDPTKEKVNVPLEVFKSIAPYAIWTLIFLIGFIQVSKFLDTL